jgi:hypothetical protein
MKRILQVVVASAVTTFVTAAAAQGVCIEDKSKESLNACAGGVAPKEFKGSKTPTTNFHSAPPPADLKKRDQQVKPNKPTLQEAPRDERKSRLQARQRALLVTEIQGLERLFETTRKNAPDRAQLARRLAEAYVELEAAAFRDKTNAEIKRDDLKKKNPQQAGQQQTQANQADAVMKAARKKAIDNYAMIIRDYPNYGQLDEVLYYLAYEYEQATDLEERARGLLRAHREAPGLEVHPERVPRLRRALLQRGRRAILQQVGSRRAGVLRGHQVPGAEQQGLRLRLVQARVRLLEQGRAREGAQRVQEDDRVRRRARQLPGAAKLADSARRDVIPVYALKGDPGAGVQLLAQHLGRLGRVEREDVQDDGRPR